MCKLYFATSGLPFPCLHFESIFNHRFRTRRDVRAQKSRLLLTASYRVAVNGRFEAPGAIKYSGTDLPVCSEACTCCSPVGQFGCVSPSCVGATACLAHRIGQPCQVFFFSHELFKSSASKFQEHVKKKKCFQSASPPLVATSDSVQVYALGHTH